MLVCWAGTRWHPDSPAALCPCHAETATLGRARPDAYLQARGPVPRQAELQWRKLPAADYWMIEPPWQRAEASVDKVDSGTMWDVNEGPIRFTFIMYNMQAQWQAQWCSGGQAQTSRKHPTALQGRFEQAWLGMVLRNVLGRVDNRSSWTAVPAWTVNRLRSSYGDVLRWTRNEADILNMTTARDEARGHGTRARTVTRLTMECRQGVVRLCAGGLTVTVTQSLS